MAVALGVTLVVIRISRHYAAHTHDHASGGPQKFHVRAVPRIGGVGILAGLLAGIATLAVPQHEAARVGLIVVASGLPVVAAGLWEDLTKRVSPRHRLLFAALSAAVAAVWLQAPITRTDLPGLDWLVGFALGSLVLTVFTVAGIANAINIIDGFNGLASMCVMLMLAAVGYVAFQVGDALIGYMALAAIGAVAGFFLWNYPSGLIFLGDGGAYFLGFLVAELGILLIGRNAEVSPLFPLLVCIYPAFETLFSIYRRGVLRQ